jgi:hypothetical protein
VTRVLDSPTTTLGKQHALIYLGREGELAHAMPRAACAQLVPPAYTAPRSYARRGLSVRLAQRDDVLLLYRRDLGTR